MFLNKLKFKGEEERNLRHFYDCREGKLRGIISSKLFQEIQNVSCHCNTYNSAINRLYLSASFQITYLQSPCQMLRYQLFIKAYILGIISIALCFANAVD